MTKFDDVVTIVPCRANSKRFPMKNIANFNGYPLVVNTIKIAKNSGVSRIAVSTNDPEVISTVNKFYTDIIIIERPFNLCASTSRSELVALHAIDELNNIFSESFNSICFMQVTSPLLKDHTLTHALHQFKITKTPSLVAVNHHYIPVGAFYLVNAKNFKDFNSFYQPGGSLYILPNDQCLDVDYAYQLEIAHMVQSGKVVYGK